MNKVFPVTIQKGSPHSFELIFILMSNQVVNTSSVQAQFAALATDKEKLRSMIASADQQRRDEEQQLDLMRKEQQTLHEAIGTAHSQVGRMKKKRQHYMQDKEKWTLKLEEEQVEMKRITELIHDKEAQEQEMKIQFCKQMESYHDELLLLMQKCYEKKFIQLMSGSTMMTACQDLIFEFLSSSSNTCTVSTNNNSCNKNMNIVHDGNDNKVMEDFLSSSRDLDTADPNTSTTTTTMIHDENTLEHDTYTFDAKKNIQILCNQLVMEEEKYMTLKRMEEQLNDSYVSLRINALEYCSNPMNGKLMNESSLDQLEEGWMMDSDTDKDDYDQLDLIHKAVQIRKPTADDENPCDTANDLILLQEFHLPKNSIHPSGSEVQHMEMFYNPTQTL